MFWRFHGPVTPQNIALITFLHRAPDLDRLRETFARAVSSYPRMRSVIQPGEPPALQPLPAFDIHRHVEAIDLPASADRNDLLAELTRGFCAPLPFDRPLWHALLISNCEEAALLWRINHLVADGLSAIAFAYEVCGEAQRDVVSATAGQSRSPEGFRRRAGLWLLRSLAAWGRLRRAPSPLNGESSPQRRLTFVDLDRSAFRSLTRRFGATQLEVLLNVLASALRGYHQHHGAPVSRDLIVVVPYADQPAARPRTQGNFFGSRYVRLPISEPDPIARFGSIRRAVRQSEKEELEDLLRFMAARFHRLPGWFQRGHLWDFAFRCHAACTVLPSRFHRLRLDGQPIEAHYAGAALPLSHGAAFTFLSSGNALRGLIVSDPAIVADAERLRSWLLEGLDELATRKI